jgi:hypothetical protein
MELTMDSCVRCGQLLAGEPLLLIEQRGVA